MNTRAATQVDERINIRLTRKITKEARPKFEPRRYQKELFQKCLASNTIIYLGTGLGKTYIIVLYLNDPKVDHAISSGRKAVFLATTQDLVKQQATYINEQVRFRVKIFCGRTANCGKHIDHWNADIWNEELSNVDILFMTPAVFLNAISTNLIKWTQLCVLFFDECHHGSRPKAGKLGSPYNQLMKNFHTFYNLNTSLDKPRIIGLTASLINRMPKNRGDVVDQVRILEKDFASTCVTDLVTQNERPQMIMHLFTQTESKDNLFNLLNTMIDSMNTALKSREVEKALFRSNKLTPEEVKALSFHNRLKLAAAGFSIKPSSFPKVLSGLKIVHQRCGLWPVLYICERLSNAIRVHGSNGVTFKSDIIKMYTLFKDILTCIAVTIAEFLNSSRDQEAKYIRSKAKSLLDILNYEHERTKLETEQGKSEAKTFSCIVFVRSRLEVVALNGWLQRVSRDNPNYSFIKADYAIGLAATMASKYSCITKRKPSEQSKMLENFRKGLLNVIVTTSVLEEGIDLPRCSTVIRYDDPRDFREYVQSRGRARQQISTYVIMSESNQVLPMTEKMNKFNDFEYTVREAFQNNLLGSLSNRPQSTASSQIPSNQDMNKEDIFTLKDNHVQISSVVAKTILHMYCGRLSKGVPFSGSVSYERVSPTPKTYQTTLFLPSGCPIEEPIVGNIKSSTKLSDGSAVVAAVKRLHELGEINDNAVPARISEANIDALLKSANLDIEIEGLNVDQSGIVLTENEKPVLYFKPHYLYGNTRNMMHDFETRTFKFVSVQFKPDSVDSREETRRFYTKPSYALVLDHKVDISTLPDTVYSHYGRMNVEYTLVYDNFVIDRAQNHLNITNFMLKLFQFGLLLKGIDRTTFTKNCNVYILPIDDQKRPDLVKSARSFGFGRPPGRDTSCSNGFLPDDLVKFSKVWSDNYTKPQLYVVKAVRRDLNVNSMVPGQRRTFLELAREKYGREVVQPQYMNQPIIEVVPIAQAMSELKEQKRSRKTQYESRSLFYLDQFLDYVNYDTSSIFQALSLGVIFYKASQISTINELSNDINQFSAPIISSRPESSEIEVLDFGKESVACPEQEQEVQVQEAVVTMSGDEPSSDMQDVNMDHSDAETDSDIDNISDLDPDSDDYDSDSTDSQEDNSLSLLGKQEQDRLYEAMVSKNKLNLGDDDDDEKMRRWDMSEYSEPNLKTIEMIRRESHDDTSQYYDENIYHSYRNSFKDLHGKVAPSLMELCHSLRNFEFLATGDEWALSQDELDQRQALLDKSHIPTIKFDNFQEPLLLKVNEKDHTYGLIEAFTLRSASEAYDLEAVENMGDSFLKYIMSVLLFCRMDAHEGFLTSARMRLTSNKFFEYLAKRKKLGSYAIKNAFSRDLLATILGRPVRDKGDIKSYYNRLRAKDLADIFEAVIGYQLVSSGQSQAIAAIEWFGLNMIKDSIFDNLHEGKFKKFPTSLVDITSPETSSMFNATKNKLKAFEEIIGYQFRDSSYLIQAFTHASYLSKVTRSYERLEFLGDSVIDFLVSTTLYSSGIRKTPGQLTMSRSALVNNVAFARLSLKYKFDLFVLFFDNDLYDELVRVRLALSDDPNVLFMDLIEFDSIVKFLGDLFESVAGAIYLDSQGSLDQVWKVYYPMMKENIDQEIIKPTRNPVMILYETFPGKDRISFQTYEEKYGDGIRIRVECIIKDFKIFEGCGQTKHQAKLRAVATVLENLPRPEVLENMNKKFLESHPQVQRFNNRNNRSRTQDRRNIQRNRQGQKPNQSRRFVRN